MKLDKYKYHDTLGLPKTDKISLTRAMAAIARGVKKK